MRDDIATYRGDAIHLSLGVNWSFSATPLTPDRPILARAEWGNYPSSDRALETAKREIDDLFGAPDGDGAAGEIHLRQKPSAEYVSMGIGEHRHSDRPQR
jgi:hypothetical protein